MSDTKKILRKLLQDHVGKENAITQSQLAEALELNPSTLRSELRRIRDERELPIGNLRDGYFVISSKEELQEYVGHINGEIESKRRTIEATTEAWEATDTDDVQAADDVVEQGYDCAKCKTHTPRDSAKWPKSGPYENQVICKSCYGALVIDGEV